MLMIRFSRYYMMLISVLICSLSSTAQAMNGSMSNKQIRKAIAEVRKGPSSTDRNNAAMNLPELIEKTDPKRINDKTIEELIDLLDIPDHGVRGLVTDSLGIIGPRAKAAIPKLIAEVRKGPSSTDRYYTAMNLAELIEKIDPKWVSDKTIEELIDLLDIPDHGVHGWVAGSLGIIGPRAKAAIPKLMGLLPEVDRLKGEWTPAQTIRIAITRIGGTPPPKEETKTE